MSTKFEVKCDLCQKDLTDTGNCDAWLISVRNERIPSKGGIVTLMNLEPLLPFGMDFCSVECLKGWFQKKP